MNDHAVVDVEGLWKQYDRRGAGAPTLKQFLLDPLRHRRHNDRFWALQDVTLALAAGEALGVIGANGSGKSTLLRLIGGLGKPTRGRITTRRRADAMLTLGESFDPLLTGRENATTAAIVSGQTRRQVKGKLAAIAAFAELDAYFDHPLRTYSDGMRMRLAFAVAATTDPELLLIDEVLAVGDLRFQARCYERLDELRERGVAIVLASHDEDQIRRVCDRVLWLSRGRPAAVGSPDEVFAAYRRGMEVETERRAKAAGAIATANGTDHGRRLGTQEVVIAHTRVLRSDAKVGVELLLEPRVPIDDPIVAVSLHRLEDAAIVLDVSSAGDRNRLGRLSQPTTVTVWFDRIDVAPGTYRFDVGVYERDWSYVYDYHQGACNLDVGGKRADGFGPPRRWTIESHM